MPNRNTAVMGNPYVYPNSFSGYTPVESSNPFARMLGEYAIRPIAELSLLNPDGSLRSDYEASAQQFFNDQFNNAAGRIEHDADRSFWYNQIADAKNSAQYQQEAWNKEREKLQNQNSDLTAERDFYRDRWNATRPQHNPGEIKSAPKFINEANASMSQFDGNQWSDGFKARMYGDISNGNFTNFINWPKEVQDAVLSTGLLKNDPRKTPVAQHLDLDNTLRTIGSTMVAPAVGPFVTGYNLVKERMKK